MNRRPRLAVDPLQPRSSTLGLRAVAPSGDAMKRLAIALVLSTVLAAGTAHAQDAAVHTFTPTISTQSGIIAERLGVDAGGAHASETRSLWVTRLALGVEYAVPGGPIAGHLRATTSLGVGVVYALGQWPLQLRQEVTWVRPVTSWLAVEVGLGTGVHLNVSDLHRSYWDVGVPIGLEVAGTVELVYYPALMVALGSRREPVFGGEKTHGMATGLAPVELGLRLRLERLGF